MSFVLGSSGGCITKFLNLFHNVSYSNSGCNPNLQRFTSLHRQVHILTDGLILCMNLIYYLEFIENIIISLLTNYTE